MKIIFNSGWVLVIDIVFVYPDDLMFFLFFFFVLHIKYLQPDGAHPGLNALKSKVVQF